MRGGSRWIAGLIFGVGVFVGSLVAAEDDEREFIATVVHAPRAMAWEVEEGAYRVIPLSREGDGFMAEFLLPSSQTVPPTTRASAEYLYVVEGSALLKVDDMTYFLGPRMGVVIPGGAKVEWINGSRMFRAIQFFPHGSPYIDSVRREANDTNPTSRRRTRRRRFQRVGPVSRVEERSAVAGLVEPRADDGRDWSGAREAAE